MQVSKKIPIDVDLLLDEIKVRQGLSWDDGRINDYRKFNNLKKLFAIINSGIPKENFFFSGDLFRLHTQSVGHIKDFDCNKGQIVGRVYQDGSCSVLPFTEYNKELVAFSKSFDFTDRHIYYKVYGDDRSILLHFNTKNKYGIDVNAFQARYGITTRYKYEQEVLFPLEQEYLVKEYKGTPNKFKYYLRKKN